MLDKVAFFSDNGSGGSGGMRRMLFAFFLTIDSDRVWIKFIFKVSDPSRTGGILYCPSVTDIFFN